VGNSVTFLWADNFCL